MLPRTAQVIFPEKPVSPQMQAAALLELRRRERLSIAAGYQSDPVRFAYECLKIQNKRGEITPLTYNAVQMDYLQNRTRRNLILKSRQQGLSTVIQSEYFRHATTGTALTATLAHDDRTTQRLRRMADVFYDNMPPQFPVKRHLSNATLSTYPETHSEATIATAGSVNTGRGGSYTHVHGSEVAFYKDAGAIMAGIMQGGDPVIDLESTPNGAQGYFYELCMEALDGRNDWKLFFYPWWKDATYRIALAEGEHLTYTGDEQQLVEKHALSPEQIKWRRSKQRQLKHLFPQEYPEDSITCFLLSGVGYFGDISACFDAPLDPQPDLSHRYVAGLDFGQTEDYTANSIIDWTTGQQVALLHINRLPWGEMRRQVVQQCKAWNVRLLVAEKNSMGSTNIEELRREFTAADWSCSVLEFNTTNESKAQAMGAVHEALHSRALHLQNIPEIRGEFNSFSASQTATGLWQLAAATGHDDIVIATALAWHAGFNTGSAISWVKRKPRPEVGDDE